MLDTAEFLAEPRSLADVADDDGRNQTEERDGAEQDYELNFDHGVLWSDAAWLVGLAVGADKELRAMLERLRIARWAADCDGGCFATAEG